MESNLSVRGDGSEGMSALPDPNVQPATAFDELFAMFVQQRVMTRQELFDDKRPPQVIADDASAYLDTRVREFQEHMTRTDVA
jgi:hypothetical protein